MIPRKMPLLHKKAFIISYPVDWDLIERNIPHLIGRHDFTAFCASGFKKENKTCAVREAFLEKIDTMKIFTITADRFVYKMVRSIVGTLLEIGSGKITASLEQIIQSRDRLQVGQTALACGLILDHVTYNEVE
jgi:tRNA pseudouridine38-40 synthase